MCTRNIERRLRFPPKEHYDIVLVQYSCDRAITPIVHPANGHCFSVFCPRRKESVAQIKREIMKRSPRNIAIFKHVVSKCYAIKRTTPVHFPSQVFFFHITYLYTWFWIFTLEEENVINSQKKKRRKLNIKYIDELQNGFNSRLIRLQNTEQVKYYEKNSQISKDISKSRRRCQPEGINRSQRSKKKIVKNSATILSLFTNQVSYYFCYPVFLSSRSILHILSGTLHPLGIKN